MSKLIFEIDDKTIELTDSEARQLWKELDRIFGVGAGGDMSESPLYPDWLGYVWTMHGVKQ